MRTRTILHADLNAFYASVECLYRPNIRHLPVAVGGDVEKRHGIILAKNQLAKECGVKTGEALWQARQKCPNLEIVPPNYALYLRVSRCVREIFATYTDLVESFGLDEAWMDVTASDTLFGSGESIAEEIRERCKRELGITASVGVSFNKIFAKLGSDMKKPDATTVLPVDGWKEKVWPLPVEDLLYVGRATQAKLNKMGIETIGDLAQVDTRWLSHLHKWGLVIHDFANGLDVSQVKQVGYEDAIKGIGNSTTTPRDLHSMEEVSIVMWVMAESVAMRLKDHGLMGRVVSFSVRDKDLNGFSRQRKIPFYTALSSEIHAAAMALARENLRMDVPLRSVGVRVTDLTPADGAMQMSLFADETKRRKQSVVEDAVIDIRRRYGNLILRRGVLFGDEMGEINPKDDHVIHPIAFFKEALPV